MVLFGSQKKKKKKKKEKGKQHFFEPSIGNMKKKFSFNTISICNGKA